MPKSPRTSIALVMAATAGFIAAPAPSVTTCKALTNWSLP